MNLDLVIVPVTGMSPWLRRWRDACCLVDIAPAFLIVTCLVLFRHIDTPDISATLIVIAVSALVLPACNARLWLRRVLMTCVACVLLFVRLQCLDTDSPLKLADGDWVGRWQGLPGKHDVVVFAPIARIAHEDNAAEKCLLAPHDQRFQIRGLVFDAAQHERYRPGACVRVHLVDGERLEQSSWAQRNRLMWTFSVRGHFSQIDDNADPVDLYRWSIRPFFQRLAMHESRVVSTLPAIPVLLALATGDRVLMNTSHWTLFSDTGVSHVMSISGSHITMLTAASFFIAAALWRRSVLLSARLPAPFAAAIIALFVSVAYGCVAGFNTPTQRTLVGIAIGVLARFAGLGFSGRDAWLAALMLVLVFDPLAVFDIGAWLSFAAVASILLVLGGHVGKLSRVREWWRLEWGVFVGLLPLLLFAFGGTPLVSPLANLFTVPLVGGIVVPGVLVSLLLQPLSPWLAEQLVRLDAALMQCVLWALQRVDALPGAGFHVQPLAWPETMVALAGAMLILLPAGTPFKRAGVLMLLPLLKGPGFDDAPTQQRFSPLCTVRPSFIRDEPQQVSLVVDASVGRLSLERALLNWTRQHGYGWSGSVRDLRFIDWLGEGFASIVVPKSGWIPGQIALGVPRLSFPCEDAMASENGVRVAPGACVVRLPTGSGEPSLILAGDLAGDRQRRWPATSDEPDLVVRRGSATAQLLPETLETLRPHSLVFWRPASQPPSPQDTGTMTEYHVSWSVLPVADSTCR